ncbi:hypothetical protein D3C72_2109260 [compost metagenome]
MDGHRRHVVAIDDNLAGVEHECTGDGIEHAALAGAVRTDDHAEFACCKAEAEAVERDLFVCLPLVEYLAGRSDFQHWLPPIP